MLERLFARGCSVYAVDLTTREVAEALRVSERQVRRLRLGLRWVQLPPGPRRSWAGLRVELDLPAAVPPPQGPWRGRPALQHA